ncbi:MAG TPA: aminotransferase class V-fold PLP-dependent enzyme [Candidatus Paceibacterota bacterium]|jgi:cysteine desulfurase|nr:aminotransferase class V-fold PLP-dependent enzyme [Candidatus Paceibacterota bacterium]
MDFFKNRIYLDYVSSTPIDSEMMGTFPALSAEAVTANPSALHKEGQAAKKALTDARSLVSQTLSAHADEIIFTSNATESDNIALQGAVKAFMANGIAEKDIAIITTDIEHSAVLETVHALAQKHAVVVLETEHGILDPKAIAIPEDAKAVIVSVMYVNNEIGTVQDIATIAKRMRFLRKHNPDIAMVLHVDATQAPLHYRLNVQKLGIDMMTLGATKLYCPKGVGMLYVKRKTPVAAVLYGGGQEFGIRPGTQAVQLIHDFAHALQYAQNNVEEYSAHISDIQQKFEANITKRIPSAKITAQGLDRTPHISHIALEKFDSELLVLELDARGVAVSAKSACKNDLPRGASPERGDVNESVIMERIYRKGWGAVRFSFGRMTTSDDVENAVTALAAVLEKYS